MQFNLVWSDGVTHLECRHQRVYNSLIDATAPALFSSLSVFVILPGLMRKLSCCADRTGNQWFHRRETAENVFGENKFSWVQTESEHETWNKTTSLARSGEITSLRIWFTDQYSDENTAGFYTEVIRGSRQREMKTLRCIQELCDLTDNIRKISSC